MPEYKITPLYNPPLFGFQTEYIDGLNDIRTEISRRIASVEDECVRKQLIAMGWTPPSHSHTPTGHGADSKGTADSTEEQPCLS